jgi:alpha-D-xyloside xylohydrolase
MTRFAVVSTLLFLLLAATLSSAQWQELNPVASFNQTPDGALFTLKNGMLRLQVCSDNIIRVTYSSTSTIPKQPEFVIIKTSWPTSKFALQSSDAEVTLTTALLKVSITKVDGAITYSDLSGRRLLQEASRRLIPAVVNGEKTYRSESFFPVYGSPEGLYGLGQYQAGVWNYRGEAVDIAQENTNIAVPLLVSTNGYGVFWNNTSRSRFNNRFANYLYMSSEVADVVDYYFIYGPELDNVVAGYRELTGTAPMFGKWAYGFWQCKNR